MPKNGAMREASWECLGGHTPVICFFVSRSLLCFNTCSSRGTPLSSATSSLLSLSSNTRFLSAPHTARCTSSLGTFRSCRRRGMPRSWCTCGTWTSGFRGGSHRGRHHEKDTLGEIHHRRTHPQFLNRNIPWPWPMLVKGLCWYPWTAYTQGSIANPESKGDTVRNAVGIGSDGSQLCVSQNIHGTYT